jgi:hypothetical protein
MHGLQQQASCARAHNCRGLWVIALPPFDRTSMILQHTKDVQSFFVCHSIKCSCTLHRVKSRSTFSASSCIQPASNAVSSQCQGCHSAFNISKETLLNPLNNDVQPAPQLHQQPLITTRAESAAGTVPAQTQLLHFPRAARSTAGCSTTVCSTLAEKHDAVYDKS